MMQTCIAAFQSMTQALSAQRALSRAAISSRLVKLNAEQSPHGCAYGLEYACAQQNNIRTVLKAAALSLPRFLGGDAP